MILESAPSYGFRWWARNAVQTESLEASGLYGVDVVVHKCGGLSRDVYQGR